MHIHFEKSVKAECDCTVLSMSWMGKVPDDLPEVSLYIVVPVRNWHRQRLQSI